MPLPAGVSSRNIVLRPILDTSGTPINVPMSITCSVSLKWAATSEVILNGPVFSTNVGGKSVVLAPVVQGGFVMTNDLRVDVWTYRASFSVPAGLPDMGDVVFVLPYGTDEYILDPSSPTTVTGNVLTLTKYVPGTNGTDGTNGTNGTNSTVAGPTGPSTTLTIGTVTSVTTVASATLTGASPNQVLNLNLPKGDPGNNGSSSGLSTGGAIGQVLTKLSITDYDSNWQTPRYIPTGGGAGQALIKTTATAFDATWTTIPTNGWLPIGGTVGQVLTKNTLTDYDDSWATPRYVPAGGALGQVLKKISAADHDYGWGADNTGGTGTGLPTGGTINQILRKSSTVDGAAAWAALVVAIAEATPGSLFVVQKVSGAWPVRPSNRTDIFVAWKGADPSPDINATYMLNNVDVRWVTP
jgi:hypothetical protein